MHSFFRIDSPDADHDACLVPAAQACEPWGGGRAGPCDKCGGAGETRHRCLSCLLAGPDDGCPACRGRVRWRSRCPVCRGTGEIDPTTRHGVSVFPRPEGLVRYMLDRGAGVGGKVIVEMEGVHSGDEDFDADEGALLIVPTRIVAVRPVDAAMVESVREARAA